MQRNIEELGSRQFDLLVVGGGIFGACAARDAAQRGLSVAVIERGDLACATSANTFKLVHGGFRYLQHLDIPRVRESSHARRAFLRVAPHLVHPLPIVVPTYRHGMKGKTVMRLAMALYDAVTFDRNAGIRDPSRRVPRGRCLSRAEVLESYPGLDPKGLTGAAVFYDGQMYNPPRLVLAYARSAAEDGAVIANYVEALDLLVHDDAIRGVEAYDVLGDQKFEIRARTVLNAAGPYSENLLDRGLGRGLSPEIPWSRDAYFVVPRPLVPDRGALALEASTRDRDAVLSRGPRHLFLAPWHGSTLVGVWHKVYRGSPDGYRVDEAELREFIDEIERAYNGLDLRPEDISMVNAGLIPFGETDPDSPDLRFGHRSHLVDHAHERGLRGLVTLVGVRYTMAPMEAPRAVDLVFEKLGRKAPRSRSGETPLVGGDIEDVPALIRSARRSRPASIPPEAIEPLVRNHGTAHEKVVALVRNRPSLATTIGSSTVLHAEIVHAARQEMAVHLEDVVLRRTDLGTDRVPDRNALDECLDLMATELGWDSTRRRTELERLLDSYPDAVGATAGSAGS